jgi:hypothetical protein
MVQDVILSAAKDLEVRPQILRCAQDDRAALRMTRLSMVLNTQGFTPASKNYLSSSPPQIRTQHLVGMFERMLVGFGHYPFKR